MFRIVLVLLLTPLASFGYPVPKWVEKPEPPEPPAKPCPAGDTSVVNLDQFSAPMQFLRCQNPTTSYDETTDTYTTNSVNNQYDAAIKAHKREIAYWVGRDRGYRSEYVGQLELDQYAWQALGYLMQNPSKYCIQELKQSIGEDAFNAGIMPPTPGVYIIE